MSESASPNGSKRPVVAAPTAASPAPAPGLTAHLGARDLLLLHRTSSAITRGLDPRRIARAVTDAMEEILSERRAAAVIVRAPGGPRVLAHTRYGLDGESLRPGAEQRVTALLRSPLSAGIIQWVLQNGEAVRLGNVNLDPRYLQYDSRVRSELCVPMSGPDGVSGAINVESADPDAFDQRDETLLGIVANQLSAALENARLFTETCAELNERRELEARLRQSERRFRKMLERGAELVALLDDRGVVRYASDSAHNVLGNCAERFLRFGLQSVVHDKDRSAFLAAFHDTMLNGESQVSVALDGRNRNGRQIQLEIGLRNLLDDQDVEAVVAIARDVSERHAAEEANRLHTAVVESTRDGIVVTEPDGRVLTVNPAFTAITGYPESALIGQKLEILRPDNHDVTPYQEIHAQLRANGHWQGEIRNRRSDGTIAPSWLTINAVHDVSDRPQRLVGIYTDISQLKASQAETERLANFDSLTDLPNRNLIMRHLARALARARRNEQRVAVLYIDLDRFKLVNDGFGHAAGDELLCAVAQRLALRLRECDSIGRLGGDEFLVVLESVEGPEDAAQVARDLQALLEHDVEVGQGGRVHVGASIGVSIYPDDGQEGSDLVRNADAAMYLAKEQGRRTLRFYSQGLTKTAQDQLSIEMKLREAVARRAFTLAYQPIMAMDGARVMGAEALIRWTPPGGGPVSPAQFIPIAEDTGLIAELGAWVLREACGQLARWADAGYALEVMAVNVSPRQFEQDSLVGVVRDAIDESGIDPRQLELEITESGVMRRARIIEQQLRCVRSLGVRLAIDDFGTGYSSLSHLKRFPVNKLKIDKSFVADLPQDRAALQIATAVISMGRCLDLEVLAEGVETESQRQILEKLGCDSFQGFLVSSPVPAADFERVFLSGSGASRGHD